MDSLGFVVPRLDWTSKDRRGAWKTFKQQFTLFLRAAGKRAQPDGDKVAMLLSAGGEQMIQIFNSFDMDIDLVSLEDVLTRLDSFFEPQANEVVDRFVFRSAKQAVRERGEEYIARLLVLAKPCNFGDELNKSVRDQFVFGCNSDALREKLFREAKLSLDMVRQFSQAFDSAASHMETFRGDALTTEVQATSYQTAGEDELEKGDKEVQAVSRRTVGQQDKTRTAGPPPDRPIQNCMYCGGGHTRGKCPAFGKLCNVCQRRNHFAKMCRSGKQPKRAAVSTISTVVQTPDVLSVAWKDRGGGDPRLTASLLVNGKQLDMEVDTGSSISLIPSRVYEEKFRTFPLVRSNRILKSFTGEEVPVEGILRVHVAYREQLAELELHVVRDAKHVLLGRDWLRVIKLNWVEMYKEVHAVPQCISPKHDPVHDMLQKHETLFNGELGLLKGIKAHIELVPGAKPVFTRPYRVPFAMRPLVEAELDRLTKQGVLEETQWSEWGTGVVPITKKSGQIRLCGNYKTTVNPQLKAMPPPNINIEDILSELAGGVKFSTLDLANAYNQMELTEESKGVLTLSTHKGLFKQNRLVFGITTAPALWQNAMERVLQGLPGVKLYLDDILVTGRSEEEHLSNLDKVLTRLREAGLKLKEEKCNFSKESVEYLGCRIDSQGLHKSESKMADLMSMPRPTDVRTLRSFLGLMNYYRKYVRNIADILVPLTKLLEKNSQFVWNRETEQAFVRAKQTLADSGVLVHFDPSLPITVACDASPVGVGAVLSHIMPNGEEMPIQFASRTLSSAERNYAQFERENLAVVFGLKKFYAYLFGRAFTLITDNKPLAQALAPHAKQPPIAAERVQRWAMFLSGFNYTIQCRSGKSNANADGLSRLPTENRETTPDEGTDQAQVLQVEVLPITSKQIREQSRKDPRLAQVMRYTQGGWPTGPRDKELDPYFYRRHELSIDGDILLWGKRVVIPQPFRASVLEELHAGHMGVVKMKGLARSYVWWPKIDESIEQLAKACTACQMNQANPAKAPAHPWIPCTRPWERIHVDYAGPVEGQMLLVVVDAFSKWPEVVLKRSSTSTATIDSLRTIFSRQGIPQTLVSDNGPQFRSEEFKAFMDRLGVFHTFSPPYHPSTNGQAERFVQTAKAALLAATHGSSSNLQQKLDTFLLAYRTCIHAGTGETPSARLMGRALRTRLDALLPHAQSQMDGKLFKETKSQRGRSRCFQEGDLVWARDYLHDTKWVPGSVLSSCGPLSYMIQVQGGTWHRHIDQLQDRGELPERDVAIGDSANMPMEISTGQSTSATGLGTPRPVALPQQDASATTSNPPAAESAPTMPNTPTSRQRPVAAPDAEAAPKTPSLTTARQRPVTPATRNQACTQPTPTVTQENKPGNTDTAPKLRRSQRQPKPRDRLNI